MNERPMWKELDDPDSWPKPKASRPFSEGLLIFLSKFKLNSSKKKDKASGLQADLVDIEVAKKTLN